MHLLPDWVGQRRFATVPLGFRIQKDDPLQADLQACVEIAREHGRSFFLASRFLPTTTRRAMLAAYAYCRVADDIVDQADGLGTIETGRRLTEWERELCEPTHPVSRAFALVRNEFAIPDQPVRDLFAGLRQDLEVSGYETWEDLRRYCYLVAGTVGLIVAPILGCRDERALPCAVELGVAMQLTNILRDVREDAERGRLYLPREDLCRFGVDERQLRNGRGGPGFPALMAFEIERARAAYRVARGGITALSLPGQVTTLAASHLYSQILNRIEEERYDVLGGRVSLSPARRVASLPAIAGSFARLRIEAMRGDDLTGTPTH